MQSEIRNMSIECTRVGGINLAQGICDLTLPDVLPSAAMEAMQNGMNHYTRHTGTDYLRSQISQKVRSFNGINADPDREIVVSAGATGAFYSACYALLNPGDEVILFEPYYGYHEYTLVSVEAVPVYFKLSPPDFEIDFDELEKVITGRTKALVINTPGNPSGKIFSRGELEQIAKLCEKHDLLVFSDEIYEYITFDGCRHISPASIRGLENRTVTVSGYSKTYSITGWRIGYSIASETFSKLIGYASDLFYVCAPSPLQYAVAKAIETLPPDYYESIRSGYEEKRNLICKTLREVGLEPIVPKGAYYVLADVTRLPGENGKDKALWFLSNTGVAGVPGEAFYRGDTGKNLMRLCFAKDTEVIEDACKRIKREQSRWN